MQQKQQHTLFWNNIFPTNLKRVCTVHTFKEVPFKPMLAVPPAPTLASVMGDAQAKCADFWRLLAEEQPAPSDATVIAIGNELLKMYHRTRLGGLFAISVGDSEACIAVAAPGDNARGWRLAIEHEAGFTFASSPNVPKSAELAMMLAPANVDGAPVPTAMQKRLVAGELTISDDLADAGHIPDSPIAPECFEEFTCDPMKEVVDEAELQAFVGAVVSQFAATHGKINFGAPLLRKCGAHAHRRIKYLPPKGGRLGSKRKIATILYDKTNNRSFV